MQDGGKDKKEEDILGVKVVINNKYNWLIPK